LSISGSTPPHLPRKTIEFAYDYNYNYNSKSGFGGGYGGGGGKRSSKLSSYETNSDDGRRASFAFLDDDLGGNNTTNTITDSQIPSAFKNAGILGTGDAGSTIFTINRLATIDSDNKPHKVMITARQFTPQIVHYAVPSVSASVYLQAKVRNNSPFPLLASQNVSIYLDGNFMSKSTMKQASSGESFQIFIGVDPSVKVEYLPVRKEQYTKGWMSGYEVKKIFHSTILHNTKSTPIKVIMAESLPRTSNDKITIDLMEPSSNSLSEVTKTNSIVETSAEDTITNLAVYGTNDGTHGTTTTTTTSNNAAGNDELSMPKDFITKNKTTNNIVWLKTIAAQQKVQINFSYRISWPSGQNITEINS
jgi:uncharacterized protein (TIGR02231 family)